VRGASLHVEPSNAAAVALYRAAGFEVEAEVPGYFGPGRGALRMAAEGIAPPPCCGGPGGGGTPGGAPGGGAPAPGAGG
jgi:hypothetical protein